MPAKPKPAKPTKRRRKLTKVDEIKGLERPILTVNQRRFLTAYSQCASITTAAETAGVVRQNHYVWLRLAEYAAAFASAKEAAVERLEGECYRRAMRGSDNLLMFALKRHIPAYRDRQHIDMTTDAVISHQTTELSDVERADRIEKLLARARSRMPALPDAR
jgi:hypothetical protein